MTQHNDGFELGDVLVTACLLDDEDSLLAAVRNIPQEWVRDALIYLAQQYAHMWEISTEDPLGEWCEAQIMRAAMRGHL